jgi:hypothetical protein
MPTVVSILVECEHAESIHHVEPGDSRGVVGHAPCITTHSTQSLGAEKFNPIWHSSTDTGEGGMVATEMGGDSQ